MVTCEDRTTKVTTTTTKRFKSRKIFGKIDSLQTIELTKSEILSLISNQKEICVNSYSIQLNVHFLLLRLLLLLFSLFLKQICDKKKNTNNNSSSMLKLKKKRSQNNERKKHHNYVI